MFVFKKKEIWFFLFFVVFYYIGQANASVWHGQEEMAGYLPAGAYSLPFIRVQWDAYNFSKGGGEQYRYGKPLTATEKQNIKNINLTASESKNLEIYQIGGLLFLLPRDYRPVHAGIGMDGSAYIEMLGPKSNNGMSYQCLIGEMAKTSAATFMPWVSHQNPMHLQAAPLDHHRVSAFRYTVKGYPVDGVAYFQPNQESMQVMKFFDTYVQHSEKTQILNFFISNYVHKSTKQKEIEHPNANAEARTYEEYKTNRNEEISPICAAIFLQYEEFFHKSMRNIARLDSYGAYTAANNMKKLMDITINGYQETLNNGGCSINLVK